jgi:pyridoxine 5-phosphate synthase
MTKLSVNINKIATLRNSRGGSTPNVVEAAINAERFGAQGITVHPRPDERHIRYQDVRDLKKVVTTEFNIEGNPKEQKFVELVLETLPTQVTLVPDNSNQLTSDHGWDTIKEKEYLKDIIAVFKAKNIRTSIFINPDVELIQHAADTGTDRIELYTESYAKHFSDNKSNAIKSYVHAAEMANKFGLGINAGHDLSLENLKYFKENIPNLLEVSIGHALISDALYFGLENTIQLYLRELR